jgi:hypothetical protein
LTTVVVDEKFDRFANDYFLFLALRYQLDPRRIKIVLLDDRSWKTTMPAQLRRATEGNPQPQPITLTLQSNTAGRPNEDDKKIGLELAGFTEEQAEDLRHYDAALFLNSDRPARMKKTGEKLLWNIVIAHHVLHMVELMTGQRIIIEPLDKHDYEERESIKHFNRFTAWVGGPDTMIDRYVPTK